MFIDTVHTSSNGATCLCQTKLGDTIIKVTMYTAPISLNGSHFLTAIANFSSFFNLPDTSIFSKIHWSMNFQRQSAGDY